MNTIEAISEYIYRELGVVSPDRIAPYKEAILSHDKIEVLVHNFKSYSLGYCNDLMLSVPEFWLDMDSNAWYSLATKLSPRPEMGTFMRLINSAHYYDMLFLEKYLGIDLEYFISKSVIKNEDKNKMRLFREEYCLSFKREETYLEDLQFFYNLDESIFIKTREKLFASGMRARTD